MTNGDAPEPEEDDRGSTNLVVVLAVLALLVIAWIVIQKYEANQQMETCRIEGRHDCDPIPVPSQ